MKDHEIAAMVNDITEAVKAFNSDLPGCLRTVISEQVLRHVQPAEVIAEYQPVMQQSPGDELQDWIDEEKMPLVYVAAKLEMGQEELLELLEGKMLLSFGLATKMAALTGTRKTRWLNLENDFRSAIAREKELRDAFARAFALGAKIID